MEIEKKKVFSQAIGKDFLFCALPSNFRDGTLERTTDYLSVYLRFPGDVRFKLQSLEIYILNFTPCP
jgi:hypothetical protein